MVLIICPHMATNGLTVTVPLIFVYRHTKDYCVCLWWQKVLAADGIVRCGGNKESCNTCVDATVLKIATIANETRRTQQQQYANAQKTANDAGGQLNTPHNCHKAPTQAHKQVCMCVL